MGASVKIGTLEVGAGHPCRCIAELGNAWRTKDTPAVPGDADRDRLGRLIDAAQAAGADAVKFQCYTADELVALRGDGPAPEPWGSQGWDMAALYAHAATPFDWFPKIKAHCERIGLPWFSSVFGLESLALLESLDVPALKIAALDRKHTALREACVRTGRPLLISTPEDVAPVGYAALFCPSGYPAVVRSLPRRFDEHEGFLGLSSHCLAPELPVAAVARGCKLIEMHMMLDDEPSALESNVSLTVSQFAQMVRSVRATEVLLGDS